MPIATTATPAPRTLVQTPVPLLLTAATQTALLTGFVALPMALPPRLLLLPTFATREAQARFPAPAPGPGHAMVLVAVQAPLAALLPRLLIRLWGPRAWITAAL